MATMMVATLLGCTPREEGAAGGAVMGALLGAVVGNQTGDSREGAAIGAVAGTIVGYHIGKAQEGSQSRVVADRLSVDCPYCSYNMGLPSSAGPGDIIECPNCHNEFVLRAH
ncbi:MAG: glycine zipper 2TM domain-containing protein [Verrucomicrobia bacterium]|nr:glycine zipper 2TM domain-containing protein [Verrucomicrobiota bacterium]